MTSTLSAPPAPVRAATLTWLAAVGAGVAEALFRLVLPDPPTVDQLLLRFGIYAVIVGLILGLRTGRNTVRWALAVLLGGVGTASLVMEPISWLAAGGSPAAFLAAADAPTLIIVGIRVVHVLAVFVALALMFAPRSNAFFRAAARP